MKATGGKYGAGIGNGDEAPSNGGPIWIYGGKITAQGGDEGAGIGGGCESRGGEITINGGVINATGGKEAAGIGGGYKRGPTKITVNGGRVYARGGDEAAGIGEGYGATSDTADGVIEITGGEMITATGGRLAAGIGGGFYNNTMMKIRISGGDIQAFGGDDKCGSAGIGAGSYYSMEPNSIGGGDFAGEIIISGGTVYAAGSGSNNYTGGAGIGAGTAGNMTGTVKITGGSVRAMGESGGAAIGDSLCVRKGAGSPVVSGQRKTVCQSSYGGWLYIEACGHIDAAYAYLDAYRHRVNCNTCLYSAPESHVYVDGACIDCGAHGYNVIYLTDDYDWYYVEGVPVGGTATPLEDPEKKAMSSKTGTTPNLRIQPCLTTLRRRFTTTYICSRTGTCLPGLLRSTKRQTNS